MVFGGDLKLIQAIFEHVWVPFEAEVLDGQGIPKVIVFPEYFYGGFLTLWNIVL